MKNNTNEPWQLIFSKGIIKIIKGDIKMKNQGFTLIELLAVIILLAIIAAITFPTVQGAINDSRENAYEEQVETIEYAAERWSTDNHDELPTTDGASIYRSINFLQEEGYLSNDKEIEDPRDNTKMNGCVKITYDESYNQYAYQYGKACS